jgi:hypothetical protein
VTHTRAGFTSLRPHRIPRRLAGASCASRVRDGPACATAPAAVRLMSSVAGDADAIGCRARCPLLLVDETRAQVVP